MTSYFCWRIGGQVDWQEGQPCPECGDKRGHAPPPSDACMCGKYGAKSDSHACVDNLLRQLNEEEDRVRYGCDKCELVFTEDCAVRWIETWNGKMFVRSYRCEEHLPRVDR
jgi:hypothetical protein